MELPPVKQLFKLHFYPLDLISWQFNFYNGKIDLSLRTSGSIDGCWFPLRDSKEQG